MVKSGKQSTWIRRHTFQRWLSRRTQTIHEGADGEMFETSKGLEVELTGVEPVTSSMPW